VLVAKGLSSGAALAFLLAGPATNLVLLRALATRHGWVRTALYALAALGAGCALGWGLDAVPVVLPAPTLAVVHDLPRWLALGALALLTVISVLRQGVDGFVGQVLALHGHGGAGHHHHHHRHHGDHCELESEAP